MSGASEVPVCIAIVLCNDFIEDKRTNNKTLIGLFNAIHVQQIPATHSRMVVMTSITNASSAFPISLIIRAPSGAELARINAEIPASHPLATNDIVFEINGLVVNEYGTHNIDILNGSSYMGGRRFDVISAQSLQSQ
jgi:hypothetical protein